MKIWFVVLIAGLLFTSCSDEQPNTEDSKYPMLVESYKEPKSTLYLTSETSVSSQSAELRFDSGGVLSLKREGSRVQFKSTKISKSLVKKTVEVMCSPKWSPYEAVTIGNFQLGKNSSWNCPKESPYTFFRVS